MASRNGLNPKIRGQKGRGFGRALAAPFGWGKGIYPTGSQYFTLPGMVGKSMPNSYSFEFWVKGTNYGTTQRFIGIFGPSPDFEKIFDTSITGYNTWNLQVYDTLGGGAPFENEYNHYVFTANNGVATVYYNGSRSYLGSYVNYNRVIGTFRVLAGNNVFPGPFFSSPVDEFRFYETAISDIEVTTNYNAGMGNNPSQTEFLRVWLQFEKFESLDFSALQDGSDIRLGLRDISGNQNHAMPSGMDTDPVSPNYILKPF